MERGRAGFRGPPLARFPSTGALFRAAFKEAFVKIYLAGFLVTVATATAAHAAGSPVVYSPAEHSAELAKVPSNTTPGLNNPMGIANPAVPDSSGGVNPQGQGSGQLAGTNGYYPRSATTTSTATATSTGTSNSPGTVNSTGSPTGMPSSR